MIEAFSLKTAHLFGDALASQARLRHRVFVKHRGLPHTHYDGMEYDEFDTPAALYLVWRDAYAEVRGMFRIVPTSMPYMLERYWPDLCQQGSLPKQADIWEISRVCVDHEYRGGARKLIVPQLLCALQELCRANGVQTVIGVTRRHFVSHYIRSGADWLGPPADIEGEQEAAFSIPVEKLCPEFHSKKYGLPKQLLSLDARNGRAAA
jgi:acyl homoserine lactone synthase